MPTTLAPPLSFSARFRPLAGSAPGLASERLGQFTLYLLIALAHLLAAVWLGASTYSRPAEDDSTLAVDWLAEAPAVAAPAPAVVQPPPPVRTTTPEPVRPAPAAEPAESPRPAVSAEAAPATPVAPTPPNPPAPTDERPATTAEGHQPPSIQPPRYETAYLDNPAPAYPALSRRLGEEGRVTLRVEVSADGLAIQVELARSSGSPRLDAAAIDAVRRWRFLPAHQGERTLAGWVQIPINFSLSH